MGDSTRALCCIVPCYNEEASLPALFDALAEVSPALGREFGLTVGCVLVDDGSRDRTLELLRAQNAVDPNCHYVSFTRNFGKEAGLLAGMAEALRLFPGEDDLFVIMDADLQDPPSLLVDMVRALDEGGDDVDVAATYRKSRAGEPPIRSAFSHLFYRLMNSISDVSMRDGARDFRVMRRRVVQTVVGHFDVQPFVAAYRLMLRRAMERFPDPLDNEPTDQGGVAIRGLELLEGELKKGEAAYLRAVIEHALLIPQEILTAEDL